uniref:Uncharacterized protein n=1 Tax=Haptolina ericina TaxID=156174 RepID=A0A7S3C4A8_9EUKA|mmetsp:Transcript_8768/g.19496  ORF Transcript_8768/g.19496 Transcript_8768/m.19496 type:complete len:203 (+) Transcript_8768:34-642(+)
MASLLTTLLFFLAYADALLRLPTPSIVSGRSRIVRVRMSEEWDSASMNELRQRIAASNRAAAQLGPASEVLRDLPSAYVLIFNPGQNDEGVYTLQGRSSPMSSYVLAFEETDEAERFAQLLQAEGFDLPKPMQWHVDQICSFCETGHFELGIVPTGVLLTPPTHNEFDADAYGKLSEDATMTAQCDDARERLERLFNNGEGI